MSHYKKHTTPVPFICCQEILGDSGLIYMLRVKREKENGLSLFVNKVSMDLTLKRPLFTSDFQDEIVNALLEKGDDHGNIMIERGNPSYAGVVNIISNKIGNETRRGAGNYLIYNKADSQQVLDILEPIMTRGFTLYEVTTPSLQGKMIVTYKGGYGELDGAPILAYNDTHYSLYTDKIKQYTKYFNLP